MEYAILICYADDTEGFVVQGDNVASVTFGVLIHLVDPARELLAVGVKVKA